MEVADSNHSKHKKKKKNQTVEGKFRHDLDICSKNKDLTGAISLYDSAVSQNIRLNQYHFNAFLYICSNSVSDSSEVVENSSKNSAFEFGFRIWDQMLSNGVKPTEATMTAVARLASAKGDGDRAFELVKSMGKYGASPRLRSYDPALVCYCKNLEAEKAYNVEEHMVSAGVNPEELELAALLKVSVETGNEKKVYQYFHKLRANLRLVSESTAEIIEDWFGGAVAAETGVSNWDKSRVKEAILRNGGGWHGMGWLGTGKWVVRRSNVDSAGHCLSCEQHLDCVDIDRAETEKFSQSVASLAMEREVQSNFRNFQDWLEKHPEYEAIVDGANIGLYQQNFADGGFCISQLDAAVKELHNRSNKWPLVILHSKRIRTLLENASNRELLQEWMDQGLLYGTPYGSNDDWYWLYAAVKLKCLLVTNDEMRDHIFELLARNFFLKWKERHQVRYNFAKGVKGGSMACAYSW
ncbi:proteinaceous RNase P 2-like isoform X2 [Diospyros lotus]|uniref:proteinaceous RNase P 2-like isoform X2 n=1 Tax=Diospyros lotus TaxID=55363 RepID=UPI0022580AA5|nr:proteinaceous RNase P 2-like isoform X2 [Diospyros lotus]